MGTRTTVEARSAELGVLGTHRASRRRPGSGGLAAEVLQLQRTAGNRAVCAILRNGNGKGKKGKGGGAGSVEQQRLKAAPNQSEVAFASLPLDAQNAIRQILKGKEEERPYLRPGKCWHGTDPETGLQKAEGVGVREYHVTPSNESKRIVVRTVGKDKRVYYDGSHVAGTYTYHRVTGAPFPPAPAVVAPAAAAPVPVVPPVAAVPPVVPAVHAPPLMLPEVDDWEKLAS